MADFNETAYNDIEGEEFGTFYTARRKWITKINRLAEKYPDECTIVTRNKNGSIVAKLPQKWLKINPPKKMTEEHKDAARKRLKKIRETQV